MKRRSAILVAILFVVGALIIPSLHRTHCADDHVSREAGSCLICQTANTPLHVPSVAQAPVETVRLVESLISAAPFIPPFSPRAAAQARGPPA